MNKHNRWEARHIRAARENNFNKDKFAFWVVIIGSIVAAIWGI